MPGRRQPRNRVLADRLWDDVGREWTTSRAAWLTPKDVGRLVKRDQRVVVHGFGRPMVWLDCADARPLWARVKPHFEVPGQHAAEPDSDRLTWAAHLWRSERDVLLGFENFC